MKTHTRLPEWQLQDPRNGLRMRKTPPLFPFRIGMEHTPTILVSFLSPWQDSWHRFYGLSLKCIRLHCFEPLVRVVLWEWMSEQTPLFPASKQYKRPGDQGPTVLSKGTIPSDQPPTPPPWALSICIRPFGMLSVWQQFFHFRPVSKDWPMVALVLMNPASIIKTHHFGIYVYAYIADISRP